MIVWSWKILEQLITSTPQENPQVQEKLSILNFMVSGIERAEIMDPKPVKLY